MPKVPWMRRTWPGVWVLLGVASIASTVTVSAWVARMSSTSLSYTSRWTFETSTMALWSFTLIAAPYHQLSCFQSLTVWSTVAAECHSALAWYMSHAATQEHALRSSLSTHELDGPCRT
ncbi:uncharacterized protein MYCGRDRAFT_91505 [Zymoseptoria tritici IPO323]|uniref:Uncharacterized protein n=1 Tax=Zymoseptoria tritici (strain CBS 115943 / IPO323) TaxID=336722 RepID=F9X5J8_ZYMTI|nr:uncharacterized protein MYCGRDRAFT_91505 [Zymoseptoria tritici IPO323]EGP88694.1 hypothetical protein MYCGRDRAFT_91505 [Zymoseptoria tritici IPO323]